LGEWFADYFQRKRPDLAHFQAGYLLGVAPIFAAAHQHIPMLLTLHDYWFLCPQHTLQRSDGLLCATVPDDPLTCARCRKWGDEPYARVGRVLGPTLRIWAEKFSGADATLMMVRRARLQAALDCVAMVIAPSKFMQSQFAHLIAPERLTFSRIGVDAEWLRGMVARSAGSALRFGYVGQVAQHKGVHVLVEAFMQLKTRSQAIELHIWGGVEANPTYGESLRQMAQKDNRIAFHGRFDNRRLPEVLAGLDYLVAPSLWYENCPLTMLEAYAAGVPVIASDHGGLSELVEAGQDGLVFRPGNAADLARAVQSILDDTELNRRLQQGAQQRHVLDSEAEMQHLIKLYETVYAAADVMVSHV